MALANLNTADFIQGSGVSQTGNVIDVTGGGGGVQSVTGDGVDNTDPDNPVLSFPTPGDIGALATGTAWLLASGGTLTADNTLSGSFGIGFGVATTANNKFRVRGLGTTTGQLAVFEQSAGTARLTILDNGTTTINGSTIITSSSGLDIQSGTAFLRSTTGILTIRGRGTSSFRSIDFGSENAITGGGTYSAFAWTSTVFNTNLAVTSDWTITDYNLTAQASNASAITTLTGIKYNPVLIGFSASSALTHYAWRHLSGFIAWESILSPSQITSNQNNYNPAGLTSPSHPYGASILRLESDAARNITGLVGGVNGRLLIVANVGAFTITLMNEDTNSTAANRFIGSSNIGIAPNDSVKLWYDGTSSRWKRC